MFRLPSDFYVFPQFPAISAKPSTIKSQEEFSMDLLQAMYARHSVRSYTERPIEGKTKEELVSFIEQCRRESGLHLQLVTDEPNAFNSFMAHYGNFSGVRNYIVLAGKKEKS